MLMESIIIPTSSIFSNFAKAFADAVKHCSPQNRLIRFDVLAERVLKRLGISSNPKKLTEEDYTLLYITEYSELVDHFTAEMQYLF